MGRLFPAFNPDPLLRCLAVAEENGARTVVVEPGYIDVDYRSEFSAFYSKAFQTYPGTTVRLHFFEADVTAEDLWHLSQEAVDGYVGYMVLRPSTLGRVGRTMLRPPAAVAPAVRTAVTEVAHFFGQDLKIEAVPFVEQDRQLGRCAHAAAWLCHYSGFRRGETSRRPMAAFGLNANAALSETRSLPSGGLNVAQILELMRVFDLPAVPYTQKTLPPSTEALLAEQELGARPTDDPIGSLIAVVCRYLNSGLPVLVGTSSHAFVLCGYMREPRMGDKDWIRFVSHDDQRGPYISIDDITNGPAVPPALGVSPWLSLVIPMPEKIWLTAETAEYHGAAHLLSLAAVAAGESAAAATLVERRAAGRIGFRTYVLDSNRFKRELADRVDDTVVAVYRLERFSHHVWIVEAIDRDLREAGRDCVLGEVILDATSSTWDPRLLARRVGDVLVLPPLEGRERYHRCSADPYRSGGVGEP